MLLSQKFNFQTMNIINNPKIAQKCQNKSFNSSLILYWVVFLKKTFETLDKKVENIAQSIIL